MSLDKPFQKSDKTVTFVGDDGQEIEVVSNISKGALKVLKKQGYKKQSERHRQLEEEALKKADSIAAGEEEPDDEDEDDDEDDGNTVTAGLAPTKAPAKKAAPRS